MSLSPVLELRGIEKRFGGVHALRGVDLQLHQGRVTGLMGDNGAGKSTTMKIICGVYQPDAGTMLVHGKPVTLRSPREAQDAGIAVVYQDLALVNERDVAANVFLGREQTRFGFVLRKQMSVAAQECLDELAIRIPSIRSLVGGLSGGQRQSIAIARAVDQGGDIVLLDEPTAALGPEQQRQVLSLVGRLRDQGKAVVIVSHNVDHVMEVCDDVVVMQGGRATPAINTTDTTEEQLVALVMGASHATVAGGQS